jgi:hypothetical protein
VSLLVPDVGKGHMKVFILYHIRHEADEKGQIQHVDDDGELVWNEEEGDNLKILGVYSSEARAKLRIDSARELPGFADEPNCFIINEHKIDEDEWSEGFNTLRD